MLLTSSELSTGERPIDYLYHYRSDQTMLTRQEVAQLAADHGVEITTWSQVSAATLGCDGIEEVETEGPFGTTYTEEYHGLLHGASFLSESAFRELTGIEVDLAPGTGANILDDQASTPWRSAGDVTHITNMVTGQEMDIQPVEPVRYTQLLGCFLLDDGDYAAITQGLTPEWREEFVAFQVADLEASYPFASDLFYAIVDHSGPEVEVVSAWDPVERMLQLQEKGAYFYDPETLAPRLPVPLREGTGEPGVPNAHPRGDGVGLRILYPDDVRQRRPRRDQCPRGGGDAGVPGRRWGGLCSPLPGLSSDLA